MYEISGSEPWCVTVNQKLVRGFPTRGAAEACLRMLTANQVNLVDAIIIVRDDAHDYQRDQLQKGHAATWGEAVLAARQLFSIVFGFGCRLPFPEHEAYDALQIAEYTVSNDEKPVRGGSDDNETPRDEVREVGRGQPD